MLAHTTKKTFERRNTSQGLLWCSIHLKGYIKGNISYVCRGIEKLKPGQKEKVLDTEEMGVGYFKWKNKGFWRKGLQSYNDKSVLVAFFQLLMKAVCS